MFENLTLGDWINGLMGCGYVITTFFVAFALGAHYQRDKDKEKKELAKVGY